MVDETNAIVPVEAKPVLNLGSLVITSPEQAIERASAIATPLAKIIKDCSLFKTISGRNYVVVEGWTTLGAMLGVTPRTVEVREIEPGIFEATVELVRGSDGAVIGRGIAECGADDELDKYNKPVWANRPRYARKSMAITRATGKAFRLSFSWIMKLAGYEVTPAEEMPDEDNHPRQQQRPPAKIGKSGEAIYEDGELTEDKHWTETQNWKTFYTWTKNSLGLTHDEVHEALDVESAKDFTGSKKDAQTRLEAYAQTRREAADTAPTDESDSAEPAEQPISPAWNDIEKERFWQAFDSVTGVTVNQLYKLVGAKGNGEFYVKCDTPAKAYDALAKCTANAESDAEFNAAFPKAG